MCPLFLPTCPSILVQIYKSWFSLEVLRQLHKQKNSASRQKLTYDARKMNGMTTAHMTSQKNEKLYYFLKYEKA
jgi:hypothetical protein